ncbi:MAG: class I SAM-dependent methyltransferase [Pirellulaceae bacterium]
MTGNYWTEFWIEQGKSSAGHNPQSRVLRTLQKQPISADNWEQTVEYVSGKLALESEFRLLDLCGGNGLFARHMADQCQQVVVVDISGSLLEGVNENTGNITGIQSDMREAEFADASFERVLWYAALQYLTLQESVAMFSRIYNWLAPGGELFVGDIPDASRRWDFFDNPERRAAYFHGLEAGRPIVGTWFEKEWLQFLATNTGFRSADVLSQPEYQIYSWFRFDMLCRK